MEVEGQIDESQNVGGNEDIAKMNERIVRVRKG
jgi:hypothetical protein